MTFITYDSSNKNEFDLLMSTAKKLGYKLTEKGKLYGLPFELYKLNKLEIEFTFPNPKDENLKSYGVTAYK